MIDSQILGCYPEYTKIKRMHGMLDQFLQHRVSKYKDMNNHWGFYIMAKLKGIGALHGYEDNTLRPDGLITKLRCPPPL